MSEITVSSSSDIENKSQEKKQSKWSDIEFKQKYYKEYYADKKEDLLKKQKKYKSLSKLKSLVEKLKKYDGITFTINHDNTTFTN
jgi:hypothetical protein